MLVSAPIMGSGQVEVFNLKVDVHDYAPVRILLHVYLFVKGQDAILIPRKIGH